MVKDSFNKVKLINLSSFDLNEFDLNEFESENRIDSLDS